MPNLQFPTIQAQKIQNIWNRAQGMLDDGTMFIATNPTPGTSIAIPINTTEVQTKPTMLIYNSWGVNDPNAKVIYPLSMQLTTVVAPTSAAFLQGSLRIDINNPLKYTSGGSTIVPVAAGVASNASKATIYFGAITGLTQTNGGRLISSFMISPTIPIAKDVHSLEFGIGTAAPVQNIASVNFVRQISLPAIALPPGSWMALTLWGTSYAVTPGEYEFQFNYVER